jgi:outer membrane protein OmpU
MKHTLLASTALVALTSAASAEITVSGSARIGLVTTEGAAATTAKTTYGTLSAAMVASANAEGGVNTGASRAAMTTAQYTSAVDALHLGVVAAKAALRVTATSNTQAKRDALDHHIANLASIEAALAPTVVKTAAKKSDTTVGINRMRVKFAGSGETDGGLGFGASFKSHESAGATGGTAGSQYISGAFGKISMGDLNGADEQAVGDVSGVGVSGAGSNELTSYQSSSHNLAYSVSMSGITFAASTDLARGADSTKTGSNSALGLKWSGDMGGSAVSIGLGTSKIGDVSQKSMSASVSTGGLTIKAVSSTNDNGPTDANTEVTATATAIYARGISETAQPDTDQTALSLSYAMDAMSVTAFTKTVSITGKTDKDYSGFGFAYDLGGASLKAGFVDADNVSVMDFGVSFSF